MRVGLPIPLLCSYEELTRMLVYEDSKCIRRKHTARRDRSDGPNLAAVVVPVMPSSSAATGKRADSCQLHPARQIEINLQFMIRVGCHHKRSWLHRQQVVLPHDPRHPLVIHQHSAATKLGCDASVAVTPTMFQHDPLKLRSDFHGFIRQHFVWPT